MSAERSRTLLGGVSVLMVLCCAVAPAAIGAIAGTALGGWLGIVVAVAVAATVVFVLRRRGPRGC